MPEPRSPGRAGPAARAYALLGAGIAANENGDHQAAVELGDRAAARFAELPGHAGRCAR
ncbi:MAG: hypothetical protein ACRDSK_00050 [Actinophytocola sp.]|uniref:hypothetical protein n=1 Tax=Actinophytocola sp. TaxID=1872138 RepID=UPI003D6A194A